MTAYDLTLQALDLFYRLNRASLEQAQKSLERACTLDPDYASAFSYLALVRLWLISQGWSNDWDADHLHTVAAARKAIELDRNDALGLAIYGHQQSYLAKNYNAGRAYLERAIVSGPSCAFAWTLNSLTCGYLGDVTNAVTRAEKAVRLSPIGADAFWFEAFLSQAYYLNERYEDAIAWAQMSAAHAGSNTSNLRCLIASLVAAGRVEEARPVAQRHAQLVPGFNLEAFRNRTPLPGDIGHLFAERLRRAGVPE